MNGDSLLYHGTGIYCLAAIVSQDMLLAGVHWGRPDEPHGPRLTRSYPVAVGFVLNDMHWGEGGVLVFDRELLHRDYEVVCYQDVDAQGNHWNQDEEEEVIVAAQVPQLSRYLVNIVCDPAIIVAAHEEDNIDGALDECGWAWERHDDDRENIATARRALDILAGHPLLNRWVPQQGYPRHNNWQVAA